MDAVKPEGVAPALVTPLDEDGRLDHSALERLLEHVLGAPVAGISPTGTTGEGPLLPRPLRLELLRRVSERLGRGKWLAPGVVSINAGAALEEIEACAAAGASAVLVPPPWYYPLRKAEVSAFFEEVASRAALPLILYNIPSMTKVSIPVEVVAELAAHDRVVGIKDSSRDLEYYSAVLAATQQADAFSVLTGSDTMLLASIALGGHGTIAASVNVVPGLVCELYEASRAGRLPVANHLQAQVVRVVMAARAAGVPGGWKAAASLLGLCSPRMAPPLLEASGEALEELAGELAALGLLEGSTAR